jgi:hypothetical protein
MARTLGRGAGPRGRSAKPVRGDGAWQDGPVTLSANAARTGIDLAWVDAEVRPQDDLFSHVNGRWLATHEIPDDRAQDGTFVMLRDRAEADVRAIVEGAASSPTTTPAHRRLYASFMDVERVEALGSTPLRRCSTRIAAARTTRALARVLGRRSAKGAPRWSARSSRTDAKDPTATSSHLNQSGLGLPDESYYRDDSYAEIPHRLRRAPDPARRAGRAARGHRGDGDGAGDRAGRGLLGPGQQPRRGEDLHPDDGRAAARARPRLRVGPVAGRCRRAAGGLRRGRGHAAELRRGGGAAVGAAAAGAVEGLAGAAHRVRRWPTT